MHGLAKLCIQRPVFATMLILSLMVVGTFSYFSLGVDLFPKVDIPTVSVTIDNPGASPEEIETEITKKIEDSVNTISKIDELRSTSSEGRSLVLVTFELEKNGDVAAQEVQNKVNLVVQDLPLSAKAPVITKFDPDATPVMQIAVSAARPAREVTQIADKLIKQRIENAPGVGEVRIIGGVKHEIEVRLDPDKMRAFSLTVTDVLSALKAQNIELPGGRVDAGSKELTVRTMGRIVEARDFNNLIVANRGDYAVTVHDIGFAEDGAEEPRTSSRLDGQTAVTLVVSKQSGENTVATADAVKEALAAIQKTLPKDVRTEVVADQSVFIKAAVGSIKQHLIEGSIFASVIIFLFLANVRTTLIAAIAIPTSIVSTFALMAAMGFTLNQITMLGAHVDGGYRNRRRDYRAREHLPVRRREGHDAVSGGGGRNPGDRSGGHGDHALSAGGLPAGGLHEGHRRAVHVELRVHGGLRDRGLPVGFFHADSDAVFALHQAQGCRGRSPSHDSKGFGDLPGAGPVLHAACCAGPWRIAR